MAVLCSSSSFRKPGEAASGKVAGQTDLVLVWTGLPKHCVALGKFLSLSEPKFYPGKSTPGGWLLNEKGPTWGSAL